MKLQHLRFFAAVVDCGGVIKAAERLHVSQPAVSAGLRALEQELGEPLFDRTGGGRRLRPTSKALRFHRHAAEILQRCDAARAELRGEETKTPKLRMGVLETIAAAEVASVASWLGRHEPAWRWQVWEGPPARLAEWLRQGRVDVTWTVLAEAIAPNTRMLWQEPFVVLAPHGHRLATGGRSRISLADLDGEPLVLRSSCELKEGRLRAAGVSLRVVAKAERDDLALHLVAQGAGIAIAPLSLATSDVAVLPVADLELSRSVGVKWRPDLPPDGVAAVLSAMSSLSRAAWPAAGPGGTRGPTTLHAASG
jgi:DNA-binding transcriptional LysR family regulator